MDFMIEQHEKGRAYRQYKGELEPFFDTLPEYVRVTPPPIEERYSLETKAAGKRSDNEGGEENEWEWDLSDTEVSDTEEQDPEASKGCNNFQLFHPGKITGNYCTPVT